MVVETGLSDRRDPAARAIEFLQVYLQMGMTMEEAINALPCKHRSYVSVNEGVIARILRKKGVRVPAPSGGRARRKLESLSHGSLGITEASRIGGLSKQTLAYRLDRGMSVDEAMSTPIRSCREAGKLGGRRR